MRRQDGRGGHLRQMLAGATGLACAQAGATNIDVGNPDLKLRWDACRTSARRSATDESGRYFTTTSKNYGMPRMPDEIKARVWDVFLSDKAAIESIQSSYDALGADTPDTSVRVDQAALRYRRMVADALAREEAAAPNGTVR